MLFRIKTTKKCNCKSFKTVSIEELLAIFADSSIVEVDILECIG